MSAASAPVIQSTPGITSVGLFRNPRGLAGFSMERYAESLGRALGEVLTDRFSIEEVCPSWGEARLRRRPGLYLRRYPNYMRLARSSSFDLNHVFDQAYGHLAFALDPCRTIVTCHDVFPLLHSLGAIEGLGRRRIPPLTVRFSLAGLRRARFVIAVSHATRQDLVDFVGVDPARVHVVPNGIDDDTTVVDPVEALVRFPLAGEGSAYVLCVDTGAPYKNQRGMLEVLARVVARTSRDVRMVRVGRPLPLPMRDLARRLGVADRVHEVGVITRAEINALYARASVLLFPSLYEGFGLPPLDAMARGVPVVASRARAVEEVIGGVALTARATDYDALAARVLSVLTDDALARTLAARGREHAAKFTWRRAADRVADLYGEVLQEVDR